MKRRSWCILNVAAVVFLIGHGDPAILRGQDTPPDPPDQAEVPERGVARLSVINGDVSVRRGDSGDWVAAVANAPLMVEDRVSTNAGSRAEVQFDAGNVIRIGANAEIRLARLEYGHFGIQVAHGTVTFRVLRDLHAQVELDTPPVSIRPSHVGIYRVYVKEDGQTEITVRAGDVEIYTPRGVEQLQAGQTMLVRGNPSDPEFRIVPAIANDEWDRWNAQRDREFQNSSSARYVPEGVYGTEELDNSGRWVDIPQYGEVWTPSVAPDWAPYHYGRWVWEDWYGWTWVSYDPWGWAPHHYGRWFYSAPYGWCWYPGAIGRHYWSPALVAFFGFGGGGVGIGFGFGNIGWVPLAPFEPFHPWWGRGFYGSYRNGSYFNRGVNVTNVNITNIYRNARVTNGVASVRAADFQQGRFTGISRLSGNQIHDAGLVRGQLPVAPGRGALRYGTRDAAFVPHSSNNIRFFSRTPAAAVQRVPLAEQQRAIQQYSRQPASLSTRSGSPNAAGNGGWRRIESPPAKNGGMRAQSVTPQTSGRSYPPADRSSGWQRFGEPRMAPVTGSTTPRSTFNGWGSSSGRAQEPQSYRPYASAPPARPSYSQPQAIRIAPPVVRERSAPRSEAHSSAPRSQGGGGSRPSYGGGGGGSPRGSSGGGSHGGGRR
ncbi:MAG: DUF6600 domain-containing protein [Bryobacteraceae bacterium]